MPPPCEINLHRLHIVVKIAMYLCFWEVHTKKRQPGQRKRTRHDRKMQSERADKKKMFALLDIFLCPCRRQMLYQSPIVAMYDWNV